jgi:hypothetical protein
MLSVKVIGDGMHLLGCLHDRERLIHPHDSPFLVTGVPVQTSGMGSCYANLVRRLLHLAGRLWVDAGTASATLHGSRRDERGAHTHADGRPRVVSKYHHPLHQTVVTSCVTLVRG